MQKTVLYLFETIINISLKGKKKFLFVDLMAVGLGGASQLLLEARGPPAHEVGLGGHQVHSWECGKALVG